MSAVVKVRPIGRPLGRPRAWPWTTLLQAGSLAAVALALAVGALRGEPQAIVTAALGLVFGLTIVRLGFRGDERRFVLTLFLAAFAVRIVAAVVAHVALLYVGRGGFLLMDDRAYDKLGWTLARVWMGIFPGIRDTDEYLMVNYTYMVAAVYYFLGHALLAAKMLNVAFGALLAVVTYALGREIFAQRPARVAAILTAFFPSLIVWSAISLKDILVVLLTATAVFGVVRYARRHEWWALALALLAFWGVENLRQFVFFVLSWILPIGFLFADRSEREGDSRRLIVGLVLGVAVAGPVYQVLWNNSGLRQYLIFLPLLFFVPTALLFAGDAARRRKLLLLAPLLAAIVALSFVTSNEKLGTNFLSPKALTEAEWKRWLEESKAEGTGLDAFGGVKPPKDMSDIVERSAAYLPRGVYYVLLGPTPWEARSALSRAVQPEMLAWYGLLVMALIGLARTVRRSWRDFVLPLGFTGLWIVALALTEGNTGNIFRHRSQFIPFVLLVSAVGLLWSWNWWRARRPAPEPAVVGRAQPTEGTI